MSKSRLLLGLASLLLTSKLCALAVVESRTNNAVDGKQAIHLLQELETIKKELSELRGMLEVQEHEMKRLTKSQQDLYLDLERRLQEKPLAQAATTKALPPAPSTSKENKRDLEVYQAAFNLVKTKKYHEASVALDNFVKKYPKSEFTGGAYYWLGEVYLVEWQIDKGKTEALTHAEQAFTELVKLFPTHAKAPDALLKLGIIAYDNKDLTKARNYWQMLKEKFPQSSAYKIAENKLKALGQ